MADENKKLSCEWDPAEKIIVLRTPGNFSKVEAEGIRKEMCSIFDGLKENEQIKILVDASEAKKTDYEARRIYTDITIKYKGRVKKIAMFKANILTKLVAKFVVTTCNEEKMIKFFDDYEKALEWLKKD
jgi:MFS superfamily sulfate permease-like transporter